MSDRTLERLAAADIMQKRVVVSAQSDSIQNAMELMTEHHVTGLPVLDRKNRCIGLISATDILGFVEERGEAGREGDPYVGRYFDPDEHRWEQIGLGAFAVDDYGETPVGEIMSRDLIAVAPDTSVRDVARLMEEQGVHRVLVLDEAQRLHGIISSIDFVRMVAK